MEDRPTGGSLTSRDADTHVEQADVETHAGRGRPRARTGPNRGVSRPHMMGTFDLGITLASKRFALQPVP